MWDGEGEAPELSCPDLPDEDLDELPLPPDDDLLNPLECTLGEDLPGWEMDSMGMDLGVLSLALEDDLLPEDDPCAPDSDDLLPEGHEDGEEGLEGGDLPGEGEDATVLDMDLISDEESDGDD